MHEPFPDTVFIVSFMHYIRDLASALTFWPG